MDLLSLKLKKFVVNNVNQVQLIDKLPKTVSPLEDVTLIVKNKIQLEIVLNVNQDIQKYKLQDLDPKINLNVGNQESFHIAKNIMLMVHAMNVSITCQKMDRHKQLLKKK